MKSLAAIAFLVFVFGCGPTPNNGSGVGSQVAKVGQTVVPVTQATPSLAPGPLAGGSSRFVGTWQTSDGTSTDPNVFLTFNADGTMSSEIKSLALLSGGSFYITGKWHEAEGSLYQTLQNVKLINMNPNLTNPKFEAQMIETATKKLPIGRETSTPVGWSGESFTLMDGSSKPPLYTRKTN